MKEERRCIYIAYDNSVFYNEHECEQYEYNNILNIAKEFSDQGQLICDTDRSDFRMLTPEEYITYMQYSGHILLFKIDTAEGATLANKLCELMHDCEYALFKRTDDKSELFTEKDVGEIVMFTYNHDYYTYYRDQKTLNEKIDYLIKLRDICMTTNSKSPEG